MTRLTCRSLTCCLFSSDFRKTFTIQSECSHTKVIPSLRSIPRSQVRTIRWAGKEVLFDFLVSGLLAYYLGAKQLEDLRPRTLKRTCATKENGGKITGGEPNFTERTVLFNTSSLSSCFAPRTQPKCIV